MLINHISVSRKQTWLECEKKYHFQYHLKVVPDEPTPIHFDYGKAVHKIIEIHTVNKGKVDISSIVADVLEGKIELEPGKKCPVLPSEYKVKLPNHIREYLRLCEKMGYEGKVEHPFHYDLDPPNERLVVGFIDRIIEKNGQYSIIDYKTTKKGFYQENAKTIVDNLQLKVYARVVQKEFNVDAKDISAALYYLDGGRLIGARFSNQTLENAEKELLETHKTIAATDPETVLGTVGKHCTRCPFKNLCPFYSLV